MSRGVNTGVGTMLEHTGDGGAIQQHAGQLQVVLQGKWVSE